jgi:hypothetical protein
MVLKAVCNVDVLAPDLSPACSAMADLCAEPALLLTMHLRRDPPLLAHASRIRLCVRPTASPPINRLRKSWSTEVVNVTLDESLPDLPPATRVVRAFEVVSRHLQLLVAERGWDAAPLEAALAGCELAGLRFHWRGPWVPNRSKAAEARVHFFVSEIGEARGEIELRQQDGTTITSDSHQALYFLDGFPRAAKTLRWNGPTVSFRPFADRFNLDTTHIAVALPS